MASKTTAQLLVAMVMRWIGTYLIKMKRKLMRPPEESVVVSANLSANDTLCAQQALALVVIVILVDCA